MTVDDLRSGAVRLYESAKLKRQYLVGLGPQYRRNDRFNAEREWLEGIRVDMRLRRVILKLADRLEQNNQPK